MKGKQGIIVLLICGCTVLAATIWLSVRQAPLRLAAGWRYDIYAADLPGVDNISFDATGAMVATLETDSGGLVRLSDGRRQMILSGLNHPDGLRLIGSEFWLTEETRDGRVLHGSLTGDGAHTDATLDHPEGIDRLSDGALVVAEDTASGRLVRIDHDGSVTELLNGLANPEGVVVGLDGDVFVAETDAGRVLRIHAGNATTYLTGVHQPDPTLFARDGAMWVTEDRKNGRLLRFDGVNIQVIARGLAEPQGIAFDQAGVVYVAEQGKGRILRFVAIH